MTTEPNDENTDAKSIKEEEIFEDEKRIVEFLTPVKVTIVS